MTQQPHAPVASIPSGGMHGASHEILGRLAVGGMAELYLARTTHEDGRRQVVVLKRILPHLAEDPDFVRMFRDEAFLAATLDHHNIVQVYDIGQDGEDYFFTMEYVHGENVRTMIKAAQKAQAQIPLHAVIQIGYGVCEGLHYAHEQVDDDGSPLNIVHRDVSPTNILVAHDGQVKIVDFGIAKAAAATHVTQAGMLKGKASYMSPEQCRAERVDRRSDVFAIGILLYEMTTLTRLFRGENELAVMHKILMGEIDPPSTRVSTPFDAQLEHIIMRALHPEPDHRYPSAHALLQELQGFARTRRLMPSAGGLGEVLSQLCGDKPLPWEDDEDEAEPEQFEASDLSPTSGSTAAAGASSDEDDTQVNQRALNLSTVIPGTVDDSAQDDAAERTGTTNRRMRDADQAAPFIGSSPSTLPTNATMPAPGARGRTIAPTDGNGPPPPRPFSAQTGRTLAGAGGGLAGPLPARSGRTIPGPPGSRTAVDEPPNMVAPIGQSRLPSQEATEVPPSRRNHAPSGDRTMSIGTPVPRPKDASSPPSPSVPPAPTPSPAASQEPAAAHAPSAQHTMALTPEQAQQMAQLGAVPPPESPPAWRSSPSQSMEQEVDEGARTIALNRYEHTMMAGSAHEGELPKGPMGWGTSNPSASAPPSEAESLTSTQRTPASMPSHIDPSAPFADPPPPPGNDLRRPEMRSPAPRPGNAPTSLWVPVLLLLLFAAAGAIGWFWVSGTGPFAP